MINIQSLDFAYRRGEFRLRIAEVTVARRHAYPQHLVTTVHEISGPTKEIPIDPTARVDGETKEVKREEAIKRRHKARLDLFVMQKLHQYQYFCQLCVNPTQSAFITFNLLSMSCLWLRRNSFAIL